MEPSWAKPPVQDAWTQAFRYSDRRQETFSRRDIT